MKTKEILCTCTDGRLQYTLGVCHLNTVLIMGLLLWLLLLGCKLLFKQDFARRLGLKCVTCNYCSQMCKRGIIKPVDGLQRDFCSEACSKKFHDWYYKVRALSPHATRACLRTYWHWCSPPSTHRRRAVTAARCKAVLRNRYSGVGRWSTFVTSSVFCAFTASRMNRTWPHRRALRTCPLVGLQGLCPLLQAAPL